MPGRGLGGVFSLFDLRAGLPGVSVVASCAKGSSFSPVCNLVLLGEVGVPGFVLAGEPPPPMVGRSFMAFSKTWGRSNAPGGWWCLLGLPCGVCCGLVKGSCEGVPGRSISVPRVWSGGGGIGSWKPSLLASVVMLMCCMLCVACCARKQVRAATVCRSLQRRERSTARTTQQLKGQQANNPPESVTGCWWRQC